MDGPRPAPAADRLETVPCGYVAFSDAGTIVQVNAWLGTRLGYAPAELIGRSLDVLLPPSGRVFYQTHLFPLLKVQGTVDELFLTLRPRQGPDLPVLVNGVRRVDAVGAINTCVCLPMHQRERYEAALRQARTTAEAATGALAAANAALETRVAARTAELQAANTQLRALARQIIAAQETERQRVARDLHDHLGQNLTALTLQIQALAPVLPPAAGPGPLDAVLRFTRELLHDVQQLAWELRPSELDDWGLAIALQRYSTEWTRRSGVPVDYISSAGEGARLPREVELTLYRVVQEALTNVLRYAQASQVSLVLEHDPTAVRVVVEDNGVGFARAALAAGPVRERLGLAGMQERVALVDGILDIESTPGRGTAIFVRVPRPTAGDREAG